jgi:putative inorganic carbon (HCO3(-)) transporter
MGKRMNSNDNLYVDIYTDIEDKNVIIKNQFRKNTQITIVLVLAVVPLLFIRFERFDFLIIRIAALFILIISFMIIMAKNLKILGNVVERDSINKALLVYLLLLVLSIPFSGNITRSIIGSPGRFEGLITIVLYIFLFIIARLCPKLSDRLWLIIMTSGLLVSALGIVQFFGYYPFSDSVIMEFGGRPYSTMGNPNFLGTYLVLIIPISMYIYVFKNNKFGLAGFALLLYCLLCTSTRGAWLGFVASIVCLVGLHHICCNIMYDEKKRYVIVFIIAVIILLIFNFQTGGRLLDRFLSISNDAIDFLSNNEESDNAGAFRGFIWKRVIQMISNKPIFGYGIENLLEPFNELYENDLIAEFGKIRNFDKAHNEYLNIAVTTGIPSLISYLAFILLVLKRGWLNSKNNYMMITVISCVVGYLIQAFFNISMPVTAYVLWIYLGLIASHEI